jgi:signal transduction histidine kinase
VKEQAIQIPERMQPFLRIMWFFWAAVVLLIIFLNGPSQVSTIVEAMQRNFPAEEPSSLFAVVNIATIVAQSATSLISFVLAGVLYFKRPIDGMALFLSYFLLVTVMVLSPLNFLEPYWSGINSYKHGIIQPLIFGPFLVAFLSIFPNGRLVPSWTRWLIITAILYAPVAPLLFTAQAYSEPTLTYIIGVLTWFVLIFSGFYAQIYRFRFVSNSIEKQQAKWVIYGFSLTALFVTLTTIWTIHFNSQPQETPYPWWSPLLNLGWILAYSTLPIALTLAVMRYRLYEIDLIINKTLVYGILTACVAGFYILIVGGAGLIIQNNANLMSLLLTAVLVTIVIRPLRTVLQRGVDRLVAGKNRTPMPPANGSGGEPTAPVTQEELSAPTHSSWLKAARMVWYPVALLASGICVAAVPGFIVVGIGGVTDPRFSANPAPLIIAVTWFAIIIAITVSFGSLFLSFLLFRRRSDDRMALLTSYLLLAYGVIVSGPLEALEPFVPGIALLTSSYLIPLFQPLILLWFAVFPDGRFVPRWMRWIALAAFLASPFSLFWTTRFGEPSFNYSDPGVIILVTLNVLLAFILWGSTIVAQIYRYRRVSSTQQKQQTKWVLYGLGLLISTQAITSIPWTYAYSLPPGSPYPVWLALATPLWLVSIAIIPLTLTIAVMRYRLFDIDFIINRSLMVGSLTIVIAVIYILVVGSLGAFFHTQGNLIIALLATGLVAVLFQPLREWLQRGVNRLIYGERDDPAKTLSRLGRQMETAVPPDDVLPMLVETIARTLKLPYVGIHLAGETRKITSAEYGTRLEEPVNFPLTYRGKNIGRLVVSPRNSDSSFNAAEMRLLQNIAHQAGPAAHAVQLTEDLRQSRVRLVTTKEEERRRLRRDLHDGLGPILASQGLKMAAASQLLQSDPARASRLLEELSAQNEATVAEIRRLVYELRPAALDVLGLEGAVRDYASGLGDGAQDAPRLKAEVRAPDEGLPPLPAAVEVAAYRISTEALTNVARHARARQAKVSFAINSGNHSQSLHLEIVDDGIGLPEGPKTGIGLISMRERAEEVGGNLLIDSSARQGTRVVADLPLVDVK